MVLLLWKTYFQHLPIPELSSQNQGVFSFTGQSWHLEECNEC